LIPLTGSWFHFHPNGVSTGFNAFHRALLAKPGEYPLDGLTAYIGACLRQIGITKIGGQFPNGRHDHFALCAMGRCQFTGPVFKFTVSGKQHHAEKIFPPRQQGVLTIMPALGGFVEGVVIAFPLVFNKVLKADI